MDSFLQFISEFPAFYIYLFLFIMILMENIIPLVPGDTVLAFSAYLAGRGALKPLFTFSITVLGSLTGFLLVYWIGYHWGRNYFEKRNFKFFPTKSIEKTDYYFNKYGDRFLLINRFLPGIRFMVAIIAGFTRTSTLKALLFTFISITAWNGLIFQIGKLLGENWQEIKHFLSKYNLTVTVIIIVSLLIIIVYRISRKTIKLGEHR